MDYIVGTAGHIDHGKTSLVRALTGVDVDRLPEEKRRGITIDLGFAELDLGDLRFGFVDVPGHERFVKNMLAGAHGIDIVALVVAADESVMPQTREHFDICRLLATKTGLIVLTKTDLVDDELLKLVKLDVAELVQNSFLENAPIVAVSSKSGAGVDDLKQTLRELALKIPHRRDETVARLPIDRAFSVKGFGAVATGTLVADQISEGDELDLLPAGRRVRVRGLQTHGKAAAKVFKGQRVAVNLSGVETREVTRGDVLAPSAVLRPTQIFNGEVEILKNASRNLKTRQRVRVHFGAAEVLARVQILSDAETIAPGEKELAQFRLELPAVPIPGERFIVRTYSPQQTIGGGQIVETATTRARRKDLPQIRNRLRRLLAAEAQNDRVAQLEIFVENAAAHGLTRTALQAVTAWRDDVLQTAIDQNLLQKTIVAAENIFIARAPLTDLTEKTLVEIKQHHAREPLSRGMPRAVLREKIFNNLPPEIFRAAILALEPQIAVEKDFVRIRSHDQKLSAQDAAIKEKIKEIYVAAGLEVPTLDNVLAQAVVNAKTGAQQARKILQLFLDAGELVRISPEFLFRREDLDDLIGKLHAFADQAKSDRTIDVAAFKNLAGVSRKYAIPLLEYFDSAGVTRRAGDKRIILPVQQ